MSDFRGEEFPKGALYAAAGLVGITIVVVFGIRFGVLPGRETAPQLRVEKQVAATVSREFRFADRKDGALVATDAKTGEVALILEPGSNSGFIRGVMRGLMRERMLHEVPRDGAVTVTQWRDGALTLQDKSTGRIIELGSFGHTNRAAFAQLLVPGQHVIKSLAGTTPQSAPPGLEINTSVSPEALKALKPLPSNGSAPS